MKPSYLFLWPASNVTDEASRHVPSGFCLPTEPPWCQPSQPQDSYLQKALLGCINPSAELGLALLCKATRARLLGLIAEGSRESAAPALAEARGAGCTYRWAGRLARGRDGEYGTRNPYAKDKHQVPDPTGRASYRIGHSWQNSFETKHDLDGQPRERPAIACQLLYGWLLLEFLRPFGVGGPKKLRALD